MKLNLKQIIPALILLISIFYLLPSISFAQGTGSGQFIPCDGPDCTFTSLLQLVQNVFDFVVNKLALPLATITIIYAGFIILTARDNPAQMKKGRSMMIKVVIGFVILLAAWLIVKLIVNTLLANPGIVPLKL